MLKHSDVIRDFYYDPSSGVLTRGAKVVGGIKGEGYKSLMYQCKEYLLHRFVWFYTYGYFPENQLDHINRNKLDNRLSNLREVSQVCNMRNCGIRGDNKSGINGVGWNKRASKYAAYIKTGGRLRHLGSHDTLMEAAAHRYAAEQCLDWAICQTDSTAGKYLGAIK